MELFTATRMSVLSKSTFGHRLAMSQNSSGEKPMTELNSDLHQSSSVLCPFRKGGCVKAFRHSPIISISLSSSGSIKIGRSNVKRNWAATLRVEFSLPRIRRSGASNCYTASPTTGQQRAFHFELLERLLASCRCCTTNHYQSQSASVVRSISQLRRRSQRLYIEIEQVMPEITVITLINQ